MVNTSKILTVSYGTFSCTLEGFDESFDTMKAIAEYFRDLAADDRYFGAEPPSPDAEMLARIAEREIARRVEAHSDQGKIILRADPDTVLPVAAKIATAPVAMPKTAAQPVNVAPKTIAPTPVVETVPEAAPEITQEPEIANTTDIEDIAGLSTLIADSQISSEANDVIGDVIGDVVENVTETASAPVALADTSEFEAEAELEVAPIAAPIPTAQTPTIQTPSPQADPESVAAKLQRIRSVVSQSATTPAVSFDEDEHAEDLSDRFLSNAKDDIEAALDYDDTVENTAEIIAKEATDTVVETVVENTDLGMAQAIDQGVDTADESISALLDSLSDDVETIAAPKAPVSTPDTSVAALDICTPAADEYEETDIDFDDLAAIINDGADTGSISVSTSTRGTETSIEDILNGVDDTVESAVEKTAEKASDDTAPTTGALRTRVIKMKRSDFEAAVADGHFEEDLDVADAPKAQAPTTSLSDDQEAELLRELAEVEAELIGNDTLGDNLDSDHDTDQNSGENLFNSDNEGGHAPHTRVTTLQKTESEQNINRLLAETNTQLDEETGKGRRNAIAHLRAAVAATNAERGAGGELAKDDREVDAYRDDLASVVRPRRPQSDVANERTSRPNAMQAAPLKLVAEQRIDLNAEQTPVRPRRVQVTQEQLAQVAETAAEAESFADFADSMGAEKLPELLEAAASYMAFVEGHDQFSRPQLMTKVRQVEQDDFSREDGLRSFGQLLRDGKIKKLKGGRFQATETISYRPDARYAGE